MAAVIRSFWSANRLWQRPARLVKERRQKGEQSATILFTREQPNLTLVALIDEQTIARCRSIEKLSFSAFFACEALRVFMQANQGLPGSPLLKGRNFPEARQSRHAAFGIAPNPRRWPVMGGTANGGFGPPDRHCRKVPDWTARMASIRELTSNLRYSDFT